jgi:hypothetical protein
VIHRTHKSQENFSPHVEVKPFEDSHNDHNGVEGQARVEYRKLGPVPGMVEVPDNIDMLEFVLVHLMVHQLH